MTQRWAVTTIDRKGQEKTEEYKLENCNLDDLKPALEKEGKKFSHAKNLTPFEERDVPEIRTAAQLIDN